MSIQRTACYTEAMKSYTCRQVEVNSESRWQVFQSVGAEYPRPVDHGRFFNTEAECEAEIERLDRAQIDAAKKEAR